MISERTPIQKVLQRKLASAKAARGYTWDDVAELMTLCGVPTRANNLMAKMSRGGLKAAEMVLIMRLLGHRFIDLSDIEVQGLDEAVQKLQSRDAG